MDTNGLDTQTIAQRLVVALRTSTGEAAPVLVELGYSADDPYAVRLSFHPDDSPVCWDFGRDLLSGGLQEPTGDGDVHVWPCLDSAGRSVVIIELCSPDGEALVQTRTDDLYSFVERMNAAVTPGTEALLIDIDSAITAILAAEAA